LSQYDLCVVEQHGVLCEVKSVVNICYVIQRKESVGLRKCLHYHYLTKKIMTLASVLQSLPHIMVENS